MAFSRGRCLLKPLLDRAGINQAELARRTGISERMISYYVKGQRMMSVDAMYNISRVLGCHMENLYEWIAQ